MSPGAPFLLSGIPLLAMVLLSSYSPSCSLILLGTYPGAMALTAMAWPPVGRRSASSSASFLVRWCTAALLTSYEKVGKTCGRSPATLPMFITRAGSCGAEARSRRGRSSRVRKKTPLTLSAYVLSHPLSECFSRGAPQLVPLLFTRTQGALAALERGGERGAPGLRPEVRGEGVARPGALGGEPLRRRFARLDRARGDVHLRAVRHEPGGDHQADAASAARDEHGLILHPEQALHAQSPHRHLRRAHRRGRATG